MTRLHESWENIKLGHVVLAKAMKGERIRVIKAIYELRSVKDLVTSKNLVDKLEKGHPILIHVDVSRDGVSVTSLCNLADVADIEVIGPGEADRFMTVMDVMDV